LGTRPSSSKMKVRGSISAPTTDMAVLRKSIVGWAKER
jgi:hypothetical protein